MARRYRESKGEGWGEEFSYPAAASFVQYLIRRLGLGSLVEAVESLGKGMPPEAALVRVYGKGYTELARDWGEDLVIRARVIN